MTSGKVTGNKSFIIRTFANESFVEKVGLLVITVILSGFLIPFVSNEIQRKKTKNETLLQVYRPLK